MRLSSSLLKSCIATMAFPSYGYMAEENKALSGLGCAVLVCRLLSRTLVYFSLAPHFFVLITPPPSMWKTAAMATVAVPEPEGKTHGRSRSRFIDVFHSPGCSLRSSRRSKVEKKKRDTLRIAFHFTFHQAVMWRSQGGVQKKWRGFIRRVGMGFFSSKKNKKQPKHPEESAHLAANVTMLFALLVV